MKKRSFSKMFVMLTVMVGIAFVVASCGPTRVRGNFGYRRPYYNYPPRPYRYAPPVVVVPKYSPPPRRGFLGRGRRW